MTLAPPASLKLDLKWTGRPPPAPARPARKGAVPGQGGHLRHLEAAARARSWWTARATEDEVRPGFSKDAILRPTREDPRGELGVLTRVAAILSELAGEG